jgi:hypothetical protein
MKRAEAEFQFHCFSASYSLGKLDDFMVLNPQLYIIHLLLVQSPNLPKPCYLPIGRLHRHYLHFFPSLCLLGVFSQPRQYPPRS